MQTHHKFLATGLVLTVALIGISVPVLVNYFVVNNFGPKPFLAQLSATAPQTSPTSDPSQNPTEPVVSEPKFSPTQIIVKLKTSTDPSIVLASLNTKYHVSDTKKLIPFQKTQAALDTKFPARAVRKPTNAVATNLDRIFIEKVPQGTDIMAMVAETKADPHVEYVEPDYQVSVAMIPNDPYYSSSGSWGQTYDDLWGLKKLDMQHAWDITQGAGVTVAVIDTGVDYNHPDIAANMWTNAAEIPDNGIDDDHNGFIDDVRGWDFAYGNNDMMDRYGHGTLVSGTIAAVGNNNMGVIGVAPASKIMAVKVLNDSGGANLSSLAPAVIYAIDNGADILNNSWGGQFSSQALTDAFHYAYSQGVVSIAAAGNNGYNVSAFIPANIDTVIAVAATNYMDWPSGSNFGYKIDVAAPGVDILSLRAQNTQLGQILPGNIDYIRATGTSTASPYVAGVAALLISHFPNALNSEIRNRLMASTDPYSNTPIEEFGMGRINAYRAVTSVPGPLIRLQNTQLNDIGNGNQIPESNEQIQLTVTLKNIWQNASLVTATLSSTDPHIASIPTSISNFGGMTTDQIKTNSTIPFIFRVGQIDQYQTITNFNLTINADGVIKTFPLQVRLGIRTLNLPSAIDYNSSTSISANNVVWSRGSNTMGMGVYNLTTNQERVISNSSVIIDPVNIDGNKVVYKKFGQFGNDNFIYIYDLVTNEQRQIAGGYWNLNFRPVISGNKVAWVDDRNTGQGEIYMYDLSTNQESRVVINDMTGTDFIAWPSISGSNIVWSESKDGGYTYDIYLYDINAGAQRQITTDPSDQRRAAISGNKIAWLDSRNYVNGDIYMYDLATNQERRITAPGSIGLSAPSISGNYITWNDMGRGIIQVYDLVTNHQTQIAARRPSDPFIFPNPIISNNKVVWLDNHVGKIFMAELPLQVIPNPLPVLTSISPTTATGGQSFRLTVTGTQFIKGLSKIKINNVEVATTFVSTSELYTQITNVTNGQLSITVSNPTPGGGTSNALVLSVTSSAPN